MRGDAGKGKLKADRLHSDAVLPDKRRDQGD